MPNVTLSSVTYLGAKVNLTGLTWATLAPPPPPPPPPSEPQPIAPVSGTWSLAARDEFDAWVPGRYSVGAWWGDTNDDGAVNYDVSGGALRIFPKRNASTGLLINRTITSEGYWVSSPAARYHIEVRFKLKSGAGRFPAVWLHNHFQDQAPARPELDLLETGAGPWWGDGTNPLRVKATTWTDTGIDAGQPDPNGQTSQGSEYLVPGGLVGQWHTCGATVDAQAQTVTYYINGVQIGQHSSVSTTKPLHLYLDEWFGGAFNEGTPPNPAALEAAADPVEFDYWRVWTQAFPPPAPAPAPTPAPAPAPAPSAALSDPVTTALQGVRTFNVSTDAEMDAVPWATLAAGDVVNIHHRAEPYRFIVRVRARGTAASPIIINGVTDANGTRPVFHGSGARVAAGCVTNDSNTVFNAANADAWQYREAIGLLGTANGISDPYDQQWPQYVEWRNLEITGCKLGAPWTDARGVSHTWSEASGMRLQNGKSITIENCVIHDNDFGVFTQSRDQTEGTAVQEPVIRNCRIYGNGMVGRSTEHNLYIQARGPLIEGNYIGTLRAGALGSAYKSRSTGEVFRYNTVEAAQRILDFVEPEEQVQGLNARADQPFVHCYGNLLVNDFKSTYGGSVQPIHLGQDKFPEEGGAMKWVNGVQVANPQLTDADLRIPKTAEDGSTYYIEATPRHTLFFWNNTVMYRGDQSDVWQVGVFDLSLAGTTTRPRTRVLEWNNTFKLQGSARWNLTEYAGHVDHLGGSVWDVQGTLYLQHDAAAPDRTSTTGTRATGSVTADFTALTARPASSPAQWSPANMPTGWRADLAAVQFQPPGGRLNGLVPRATTATAGCFE